VTFATEAPNRCPHDRFWYEDCESCADLRVLAYIQRRVEVEPGVRADTLLTELARGDHYD